MDFKNYREASLASVVPNDILLADRIEATRKATIPASLRKCRETGRIDAFKLDWKEGMPKQPHVFWDSDVAKVLEGVADMLAIHPDAELEREYDEIIDLIVSAQQPDGYLNTHFTVTDQDKRWANLNRNHELYCAGHMMEAAVAGYQLLGKRKLLDAMLKYAKYISQVFGRGPGQMRGYSGHQEIELALVRMYEATGEKWIFDLAKYFVDERGQSPSYFVEVEKTVLDRRSLVYNQADAPVREQRDAHGHAVRAMYNGCGMVDVARISGDEELFRACERIFDNVVNKRMYITGGVGSTFVGEAFTIDYDLQNTSVMYAESCAAIGLVRFAARMLNATGDGRYAETMEKTLFNCAISGLSLSGDRFFYNNYLEVDENTMFYNVGAKERQEWFDCSCCPTNFCRFIPESLGYLWSEGDGEIRLNIPVACRYRSPFGEITVEGAYPYDGNVRLSIGNDGCFKLSLRIPQWCSGKYECRINGEPFGGKPEAGYLCLCRQWRRGDMVELSFDMQVRPMRSSFKVTNNAGRVALTRGPIVYACESMDNPGGISNMVLRLGQGFRLAEVDGLPKGTLAIKGSAWLETAADGEALYFEGEPERSPVEFTAIPYYLWQNRTPGNMAVWMRAEQ